MTQTWRLSGPVLTGPEEQREQAWVVDGCITYQEPRGGDAAPVLQGTVLPGLVDAHCHIGMDPEHGIDGAYALEHARTELDAGVLLLRDAGSPVDTAWVNERADLPRLMRAGRHIARTRRYIRDLAQEVEPDGLVDAVRLQARRGDGWVKLVGDWIDREQGDLAPCWPADVAAEAIAAAHDEGARVTAHCFAEQSVLDLVAAGIDCIEHATGLVPESISMLVERDVPIVPTLVNIANFPVFAQQGEEKFPRYAAHMRDLHARRYATVAAAHAAGVAIRCGTDAGGQVAHGRAADEILELHRAGLSTIEALDAATWGARAWLGHPGLDEGAPADLVIYEADPRTDLATLHRPAHVLMAGQRVAGQAVHSAGDSR